MKKILFHIAVVVAVFFTFTPGSFVQALAPQVQFNNNQAQLTFPESAMFSVRIQGESEITQVVFEYGVEQLTCGNVIAKAFPDFKPGKTVDVSWTWEMRQSGSLPPGAKIWWRWVATDSTGKQTSSNQKNVIWLDSLYNWKVVSGDGINLHWYEGDKTFAQSLSATAIDALKRLDSEAGMQMDKPIDLYIYGNFDDMRDSVLYEPGWTGGQAFASHNIVIIGISTDNLDWGKSTVAHELTHVVTGHVTFNCLWSVPTWLEEGLATYSEGELEPSSQKNLKQAVQDDTLMSLRALSGGFSEKSDKADLSYSQSFSVVKYLIEAYGRDKMSALLKDLRDGEIIDNALRAVYGFDTDGLEDAWRTAIGAQPRPATSDATPTPHPTVVPTIQPVSGIPGANVTPVATPNVTPIPTNLPSAAASESQTQPTIPLENFPVPLIVLVLGLICCLMVSVTVVFILLARQKRSNRHDA